MRVKDARKPISFQENVHHTSVVQFVTVLVLYACFCFGFPERVPTFLMRFADWSCAQYRTATLPQPALPVHKSAHSVCVCLCVCVCCTNAAQGAMHLPFQGFKWRSQQLKKWIESGSVAMPRCNTTSNAGNKGPMPQRALLWWLVQRALCWQPRWGRPSICSSITLLSRLVSPRSQTFRHACSSTFFRYSPRAQMGKMLR